MMGGLRLCVGLLLLIAAGVWGKCDPFVDPLYCQTRDRVLRTLANRHIVDQIGNKSANYTIQKALIPDGKGGVLSTWVFHPKGYDQKKLPATYVLSPYPMVFLTELYLTMWTATFKLSPSVLVLQTENGVGNSTGSHFEGFQPAIRDGAQTLEWIQKQSWSNKVVFNEGASAMGVISFLLTRSVMRLPAGVLPLRQTRTNWAQSTFYPSLYTNGAFMLAMSGDLSSFLNLTHFNHDLMNYESPLNPYWRNSTMKDSDFKTVDWPTVQLGGWYDIFQKGDIDTMHLYRRNSAESVRHKHRFFVSFGGHCFQLNVPSNVTAQGQLYEIEVLLQLAEERLMANTFTNFRKEAALIEIQGLLTLWGLPKWTWYVMGSGEPDKYGGYLTAANEWPVAKPSTFYLTGAGGLTPEAIDMEGLGNRSYIYDPSNPYPTIGGNNFSPTTFQNYTVKPTPPKCGPNFQDSLAHRSDVLHYDSEPLKNYTVHFGETNVTLEVSSNCTDTDFVVNLIDVYPNNSRMLIQGGQIRMRWREEGIAPVLMKPGENYRVTFSLWFSLYVFRPGHRIGLDITSSNYPRITVNPNNGRWLNETGPMYIARNTIHTSSSITFPIVDISQIPKYEHKSFFSEGPVPTAGAYTPGVDFWSDVEAAAARIEQLPVTE